MKPLLSIVIANYNYGRFLDDAIKSVVEQVGFNKTELIVVDGGSTDNSIDVIKKYGDKIAWWVSEKDNGQSEAFNKGFSHAKGKFLTWLNADDILLPGTIEKFIKAVELNPNETWFVGGCLWLSENLQIIKCARGRPLSHLRTAIGDVSVWGPSSFFSRSLLESVHGVDERFHYMMDIDLWRKFYYLSKKSYCVFTDYAWGLRIHAAAKTSGHFFSSSGQQNKDHPRWSQMRKEREMASEIGVPMRKLSLLRKLASINLCKSFLSRVDTVIYMGRGYLELFGRN